MEGRREMFAAKREYSKTWKRERRCLQQKEEREHCAKERRGGGYLQKNGEDREEVFTVEQGRDQERGVYSRTGKGEKVFTVEREKEREGVYSRTGKGERRRLQ